MDPVVLLRLYLLMLSQIASNKRYAAAAGKGFTVSEVANCVEADFGKIDIIVHSLANGPEVTKPLLETSRKVWQHRSTAIVIHAASVLCERVSAFLFCALCQGNFQLSVQGYLAALSASAYSLVSMVQRFGPIMNPGGAAISLTYLASEKIIPGEGQSLALSAAHDVACTLCQLHHPGGLMSWYWKCSKSHVDKLDGGHGRVWWRHEQCQGSSGERYQAAGV